MGFCKRITNLKTQKMSLYKINQISILKTKNVNLKLVFGALWGIVKPRIVHSTVDNRAIECRRVILPILN